MLEKIYNWLFNTDKWLDNDQINRYFKNQRSTNPDIEIKNACSDKELDLFMPHYNLQPGKTILTPFLIEFKIFGFNLNHWTLLEISKNQENKVSAVLHDSMGWWRRFRYMIGIPSLSSVKKFINEKFPGSSFAVQCYGHQKNGYDCGKFIIEYAKQKMTGQDISDPSKQFAGSQALVEQAKYNLNLQRNLHNFHYAANEIKENLPELENRLRRLISTTQEQHQKTQEALRIAQYRGHEELIKDLGCDLDVFARNKTIYLKSLDDLNKAVNCIEDSLEFAHLVQSKLFYLRQKDIQNFKHIFQNKYTLLKENLDRSLGVIIVWENSTLESWLRIERLLKDLEELPDISQEKNKKQSENKKPSEKELRLQARKKNYQKFYDRQNECKKIEPNL